MLRFPHVGELVFFYGTLMAGFDRRRRAGIDDKLKYIGRGVDPGLAVRSRPLSGARSRRRDGRVWGEVYEMTDPATVLAALDEIEGYRHDDPDRSLYTRAADRCHAAGRRITRSAWVYFYNAPLGTRAADRVGRLSRARQSALGSSSRQAEGC